MPMARTMSRFVCAALVLMLSACASGEGFVPVAPDDPRMPREIRLGSADMVIGPVEQDVSREEVLTAVQALLIREPVCFPWPGLWLSEAPYRSVFYARYDLMSRDWGSDVAEASRVRMQEFVDMGFLLARPRPDLGPGAIEYTLTSDGVAYLQGSPYGSIRPSFCGPSQRRVVEITRMEYGQFDCGSLRVTFTHGSDDWPNWARTQTARERVGEVWAPPGGVAEGTVSLGRQWFRRAVMPSDMRQNGELRSLCYDTERQQVVGEDMQLSPAR